MSSARSAIVNSDSQGMGRIDGDGPADDPARRTRCGVAGDRGRSRPSGAAGRPRTTPFDSTDRVLRYLAKVTIEPAITHGISDARRLARSRAASPTSSCGSRRYFGVKPELVLKGGYPAWAPLGEGNATVERAEPTRYQPDWGGSGRSRAAPRR